MRELDADPAVAEEDEDLVADLDDPIPFPRKILSRLRIAERVSPQRLRQRLNAPDISKP